MKPYEIITKIAEFNANGNFEGFKEFMESLEFDELLSLMKFSQELTTFCKKGLGLEN